MSDELQVGKVHVSPAPESLPTNQRREKEEDTKKILLNKNNIVVSKWHEVSLRSAGAKLCEASSGALAGIWSKDD